MARRKVFLHIGLPGSGGGFLEHALLTHAEPLEALGVDVVADSVEELLRVAVETRRDHKEWGYARSDVEGTWASMCRRVFRSKGDAVVSQELLAGADAGQAALFLDGLAGREVHLVLTVRDPGSQVVAGWERDVKSGGSVSFSRFHRRAAEPPDREPSRSFWTDQDLVEVLDRWAVTIKPHRVHVIAVPPIDDPRAMIWAAFGEIVGFDPSSLSPAVARASQPGLGTTEVAVLRSVNEAIDGRIEGAMRRTVVKRYFADRILGDTGARPAASPPELYDELLERAERWQKRLSNAGYDVHGESAHLLPLEPARSVLSPDDVPARERLRTTTDALAHVLVEVARLREHNEQLEVRNAKLEKKRRKLKRRLAAQP